MKQPIPMSSKTLLRQPNYDPSALFDEIKGRFGLKTDTALSSALRMTPSQLSRVRHKFDPVSAELMLRIHHVTGMTIAEIYTLMKVDPIEIDRLTPTN